MKKLHFFPSNRKVTRIVSWNATFFRIGEVCFAPMKSGTLRRKRWFLQICRLKNFVSAQGSSLSRARERHKSFIGHYFWNKPNNHWVETSLRGSSFQFTEAIKTVTSYLDVLAVLTWVTLVPLFGAVSSSSQITVCPSPKFTNMGFPLMAIVCPSRITDVPDSVRRGWGGDVLCHKFGAECERLAIAASMLSLWPRPPPSPRGRPPWWVPFPHLLSFNLVRSERVVPTLRRPDLLSPGEILAVVEGEEGGGQVLVGTARLVLGGQATRRAISHRSAVDSARLKDESQMWSLITDQPMSYCSEREETQIENTEYIFGQTHKTWSLVAKLVVIKRKQASVGRWGLKVGEVGWKLWRKFEPWCDIHHWQKFVTASRSGVNLAQENSNTVYGALVQEKI